MDAERVARSHQAGRVCWDDTDLVDGQPTGAIRVSLGWMTSYEDIAAFKIFIHKYFLQDGADKAQHVRSKKEERKGGRCNEVRKKERKKGIVASGPGVATARGNPLQTPRPTISAIYVYPVKSMAGVKVSSWPVGTTGLLYDRQWVVLDDNGNALTQKRAPAMARITPHLDLEQGLLTLSSMNMPDSVSVGLPASKATTHTVLRLKPKRSISIQTGKIPPASLGEIISTYLGYPINRVSPDHPDYVAVQLCSEKACAVVVGHAVADGQGGDSRRVDEWLCRALGRSCRLAMDNAGGSRKGIDGAPISYANEAQMLVVSQASVDDLNRRLSEQNVSCSVSPQQFRPNLVVEGGGMQPFYEDEWLRVTAGRVELTSA
eukprot:scaffold299758_cov45-Prasinocladus_malaysianus.AAC.1